MENHPRIHAELLHVTSQICPFNGLWGTSLPMSNLTACRLGHGLASSNELASSHYSRQDMSSQLASLRAHMTQVSPAGLV
jgi:hypothetical protein